MRTSRFAVGELLLVDTIDNRPALVWEVHMSHEAFANIADRIEHGGFAVCLDEEIDASYLKVMSPRGAQGYIHIDHISKSK